MSNAVGFGISNGSRALHAGSAAQTAAPLFNSGRRGSLTKENEWTFPRKDPHLTSRANPYPESLLSNNLSVYLFFAANSVPFLIRSSVKRFYASFHEKRRSPVFPPEKTWALLRFFHAPA
jgi:hypothetical protein